MPLKYQARLLAHLRHETYEPATIEKVGADLRVDDASAFERAVRELAEQGIVSVDGGSKVRLPELRDGEEIVGRFRSSQKGFGFVQPEKVVRSGDLFIPPHATMNAMDRDTVRVRVSYDNRRARQTGQSAYTGEVVEIVQRRRSCFTGEIGKQGPTWLVYPDGKEMRDPIVVRDAEAKNVNVGDKVVVDILHYPEGNQLAEGVISRVLGEAGLPDVETQAVIAAYNLPGEFPEECLEEARAITAEFEAEIERFRREGALEGRLDLTGEFILTIDPPNAKDYDDAIHISRTEDGGWELGVHIADVAHFIPRGGALDTEGLERGNSVYLPRLVIPMLPELLSNGICSLQEGVERFAKTAFMRYDKQGNVKGQGVAGTIIKSVKRLTYLEAQALIDGDPEEAKKHAKTEPKYTDQLVGALREMDALARAIRGRRERQGMISLELPDVELVFNDEGRVVDAEREDDAFTHTLIEMFMVEANECLARLFEELGVPLLRRVHPEPTPGDAETLRRSAMVAGFKIPANPTREELQSLLNATRGTPASRAVHMAVLRTLTKAEYSPALIGHFALASEAYAHFTSPIRRYPDLTVHRALSAYLERTENGRKRPHGEKESDALGRELQEDDRCPDEMALREIGRHCTQKEENAEEAERSLRQFLVLQLLAEHVGEVFDGVVTGVVQRGVFVQIEKYLADGMVKSSDLPGDVTRSTVPPRWTIDKRTGALVDANSGRSFNMGDRVKVKIAGVDLARRQLDLVVEDGASRATGKAKTLGLGLKIGSDGAYGGIGSAGGAGFKGMTGGERRSRKSKQRDKRKPDHRRDK
ncbi:MAG: VacB/RNase II family 3'-5' exoribonuclease [Phycisphaerales bacterium]|jgi:ribonuclease R|nr:VacB/RNase II family 3'-5' exoribonuclease [Phycisphaerales bacterium]